MEKWGQNQQESVFNQWFIDSLKLVNENEIY